MHPRRAFFISRKVLLSHINVSRYSLWNKKSRCATLRYFYVTMISRTISRVMSWMVIYLILLLPAGFSDLPKNVTGSHIVFCSVLLRMGFTYARSVTSAAVVSYTALPPLPYSGITGTGGIFLLHYPWSRLHRTLSGILPCEARTFLTCTNAAAIICATHNI